MEPQVSGPEGSLRLRRSLRVESNPQCMTHVLPWTPVRTCATRNGIRPRGPGPGWEAAATRECLLTELLFPGGRGHILRPGRKKAGAESRVQGVPADP